MSETHSSETQTQETATETPAETEVETTAPAVEETTEAETTTETKAEPEPEYIPLTSADLTIPEGLEVDEEARDTFLALSNELKLPKEAVGKLVDLQAGLMQKASERASELVNQTQEQWREEAKADATIGGDKLAGVLSTVGKVIDSYASGLDQESADAFRTAMDVTGAGNHPAVIKFVHHLAKQLDEGGPVSGRVSSSPADAGSLIYNHPTSRSE